MTVETYPTLSQQGSGQYKARQSKHLHCSRKALAVATWNVHSLVEASGDECIGRKHRQGVRGDGGRSPGPHTVDSKLDLMVKELKCYQASVAGIQETTCKWFGMDAWPADGYTFLHSGQPLPRDDGSATRNEGVGIALDEKATTAWKEAGEVWEAVSS